jgi:hypothetical protein
VAIPRTTATTPSSLFFRCSTDHAPRRPTPRALSMVDPVGFDLDSCEQTQYHIADWKSGVDVRSQGRSGSVGCLTINPLPGRLTSLTPLRGVRRGSPDDPSPRGRRPLFWRGEKRGRLQRGRRGGFSTPPFGGTNPSTPRMQRAVFGGSAISGSRVFAAERGGAGRGARWFEPDPCGVRTKGTSRYDGVDYEFEPDPCGVRTPTVDYASYRES